MKTKLLLSLIMMLAFIMQQAQAQDYIIIEDFEDPEFHIPLNNMTGGNVGEEEVFQVVSNPDMGDVNGSDYVLQFIRAYDGVPWGGFWSSVFEPLDMTDMNYTHYQAWKPRVSPLRFKVEGSDQTENFEFESMEAQELTDEWETITFYYPDAAGSYPTIAVMPDFNDPVDLDENITIYLDNIILSNSAENPLATSIEQDELPVQVALKQNYPNPFNPATNIAFELSNAEQVKLTVYNSLGQEVATLVDGLMSSGQHQVSFSADDMSSGIYFYRLQTANRSITRSMTLVK